MPENSGGATGRERGQRPQSAARQASEMRPGTGVERSETLWACNCMHIPPLVVVA